MRRFTVVTVIFAVLFALMSGVALAEDVKIKDIRGHFSKFEDEIVSVTGHIYRFVEEDASSTDYYKIRDDWGGIIHVRTARELPEVNKRYTIIGVVDMNQHGTIFISEVNRVEIVEGGKVTRNPADEVYSNGLTEFNAGNYDGAIQFAQKALSQDPNHAGAKQLIVNANAKASRGKLIRILIMVAGGIFLVLIVVLIVMLIKRSRGEEILTETIPAGEIASDEGKTVVMKKAAPGTMKLLPGKFIVLKGEDTQKELRFQLPKDASSKEFTFGRQGIPDQNPFGHIQLKSQTVSRIQAKLTYSGDGFQITNHSTTNPTTVNGKELGENESVSLNDGDIITMGEVEFKYEKK